MSKMYASPETYEQKLGRVMSRLGIKEGEYDWDYNRKEAWVSFKYKGQQYRFEHSIAKSQKTSQPLKYGSDGFAQIVLALEDLARIVNRGIYDLQSWVEGMKFLPSPTPLPAFCTILGLDHIPESEREIATAFRSRAKQLHPDICGSDEGFKELGQAQEDALKYLHGDN